MKRFKVLEKGDGFVYLFDNKQKCRWKVPEQTLYLIDWITLEAFEVDHHEVDMILITRATIYH